MIKVLLIILITALPLHIYNQGYITLFNSTPPQIKISGVTGTVYNPVVEQCDADPDITADGSKIDLKDPNKHRWVALSRDLLNVPKLAKKYKGLFMGPFKYGDTIIIVHPDKRLSGEWIVHDCMGNKITRGILSGLYIRNSVDFLQGKDGFLGKWRGEIIIIKK